jgi:chemotaxis protein MotB
MAAHRAGRRASHHEEEHEDGERWLLSYADMITLLMVLFVVLFAISSVNTAKLDALSKSLSEEISGKIVTGGPSIQETGGADSTKPAPPSAMIPPIQPVVETDPSENTGQPGGNAASAQREEENFRKLKQEIDQYAKSHGLEKSIQTRVARRGLVIRLLTDNVLFDSGQAQLQPRSQDLLSAIARLLVTEVRHPIIVEGHTDSRAVNTAQFPTNWELSTTRATQVVRFLVAHHVAARRLQAAGVAAQRPLASNASESGRSRNRRVEIVLARLNTPSTSQDGP